MSEVLAESTGLAKVNFWIDETVARCCIPCDHLPIRSWPLFKARDVMYCVIESFNAEN